jgi:hypothetical protein
MGDPRERGHSARPLGRKAYSYSSVSSRSKSNSSRRSESALSRDISELVRVVDNRLSNPSKASTRTSVTNFSSTLRSNASASVSAVTVPGVGRRRGRMQRRCSVSFSSARSGEVRPSLGLATASSSSRLGSLKPTLLGLKSLCGFQRRRAAYSVANPAHFLSVRSVGFYASRKPSTSGFRSHGGTKRETLSGRFQAAFPWGLRQWCSIPLSRVVTA